MAQSEKLMVVEQIFEVRYSPMGQFLDIRGSVADEVRASGFLPHWKIEANIVAFRDSLNKVESEGAFIGYRNSGYFAYNPGTGNFFVDRAGKFWKIVTTQKLFTIPTLTRFGARTKVFLPTKEKFGPIRDRFFSALYTEPARGAFLGEEKDVQFVAELEYEVFSTRVSGGPMHEDEAGQRFPFPANEFSSCGLFLDIDLWKDKNLSPKDVPALLKRAQQAAWEQVERIAKLVGV